MDDKVTAQILELLNEVKNDQSDIKVSQAKMSGDMGIMKEHIATNTKDLAEHKQGVKQCQARLDALEIPKKMLTQLKYIALWLAAISGAILGIIEVSKLLHL